MKQTLKIVVAIIILVTLLGGNISVFAAGAEALAQEQSEKSNVTTSAPNTESDGDEPTSSESISPDVEESATPDTDKDGESKTEEEHKVIKAEKKSSSEAKETNEENDDEGEPDIATLGLDEGTPIANVGNGKLQVEIDLKLPQVDPDFKLTLKDENRPEFSKTYDKPTNVVRSELVEEQNGKAPCTKVYFIIGDEKENDLIPGNKYSIEITGNHYSTYTQDNIEIRNGNELKINLTNTHEDLEEKYGVMALGSTGTLDTDTIINKIEARSNDLSYDLNGDGVVNIVDLSYVAINAGKGNTAIPEVKYKLIIPEETEAFATTGSVVGNTDIMNILEDDGEIVELAPADTSLPISNSNPIEFTLDLSGKNGDEALTNTGAITIAPSDNRENNITKGTISVLTSEDKWIKVDIESGKIIPDEVAKLNTTPRVETIGTTTTYQIATIPNYGAANSSSDEAKLITIDPDGTIVLNLGEQIAIKKVTIKVTGTKSNKLADISKVEFLNDMSDRIPAPQISIPTNVVAEPTAESIKISWDSMPNVTGYEVLMEVEVNGKTESEHRSVDGRSIIFETFNGKKFEEYHYKEFKIRVQSVNGEWKSGYGEPVSATPKPTSKPAPPDDVKAEGKFREIDVSWKNMKSTKSYNLYYREKNNGDYKKIEGINATSYTITDLPEEEKTYQIYLKGVNDIGEGDASKISEAKTISVKPAILPAYKLINTPKKDSDGNEISGELTDNIVSAKSMRSLPHMVGSPLDENSGVQNSALGVVDNNYSSFWEVSDWDEGAGHVDPNGRGILFQFNNKYKMNYFVIAQVESTVYLGNATVSYWDSNNNLKTIHASRVSKKEDKNGREYTAFKITEPIETDKVIIGFGRTYSQTRSIKVAEMRFYNYDSLEEDIDNLYEGQLHVELKNNVTEQTINDLETRLETPDEVSKELHPEHDELKAELDMARDILANKANFKPAVEIDTTVTSAKDGNVSFKGGINAWQPLGLVAHAGEKITVYVGNKEKNIGDSTNLQLVATQYDAEAANWMANVKLGNSTNLKIGKNELYIPSIQSLAAEKGGSLYINYTGNNPNEKYAVRVIGGVEIPTLDLTKGTDRNTAITKYVEKLEEVVPNLEANHNKLHKGQDESVDYDYDNQNCILGATEIVIEDMMYSVSAEQIYNALGGANTQKADKVAQLDKSLTAMEDMLELFYSHKGMSREIAEGQPNSFPSGRQNIRYHRMFAGAAMYAGGLHIGIPWGDVQTLAKGNPIEENNGKYVSGNYFGWGISHEIGHIINDSHYVQAEVTNNYFSVLSQAKETNASVRFQYPEVYKKVTSGKVGKSDNVFTQLGLYWQLHLAYDKGYNFTQFDSQNDQLENLIFARIDTYARDPSKAPKAETGGIELSLDNVDKDNSLMRLACAATKMNLIEFFERWGFVPDEGTREYAKQWTTKEEKPIYYITDEARAYQIEKKPEMAKTTKVEASIDYQVKSDGTEQKNDVKITLGNTETAHKDSILGYEIVRSYMDNDKEVERAVAFVSADDIYTSEGMNEQQKKEAYAKYNVEYTDDGKVVYTDIVETINNRVITYKVTAIDKYLNKTEQLVLNPIKIRLDGSLAKGDWEITSNLEEDTEYIEGDNKTICEPEKATEISKIANNILDDEYVAKLPTDKDKNLKDGEIVISLDEEKTITGLKYKAGKKNAIKEYEIQVSTDNTNWETVKSGTFTKNQCNQEKVYFDKDNDDKYYTYRASYVKLVIKNQPEISIAELDLLGESGDDVDLLENGIGKIESDYSYGTSDETGEQGKIPAGSIIFTGTYKGNPAYNVVKLWDQNNELIEGSQIILAQKPKQGNLGEVSQGTWIYWIEPTDENYETALNSLETVRAELYRVDNAQTNEGERLVSDTFRVTVPKELPNIQIQSNNAQ